MSDKRIIARVDLSAIEHNIKALYKHMPNPKPIMAVVKADGYGHGAAGIAKRLETSPYIYGFATATAEEAIEIRNSGSTKPIMVLGYVFEEDYEALIKNDVIFTIFDEISAKNLSNTAVRIGKDAHIHIKVDTGMTRIGVKPDCCGLQLVKNIINMPGLVHDGIFTHFARADEVSKDNAYMQLQIFNDFVKSLHLEGIDFDVVHCANSGAILQLPDAHLTIVRAGIVIYGLWPSNDIITPDIDLQPALTLKSHVVYIKDIESNTAISYGGTYVSNDKMKIATIPVGYADGYPRSLSNKGYVLIGGNKVPIVGRICMDQMMVDITNLDVNVGDEVILLGKQGDLCITAEELGDLSGRFNYELVCDISSRVPREFYN